MMGLRPQDLGVSDSTMLFSSLYNTCDNFVAGKILLSLELWELFTQDQFVLDIVRGSAFYFDETPVQDSIPRELRLGSVEQLALDDAMVHFLAYRIIEPCLPKSGNCFYSNVFPCIKSVGPARIILNLSKLNLCVDHVHFKMDTLKDVLDLISPGCYFAKVDLKHAYYSVPVRMTDRDWLRFTWYGQHFRFTCLPQGYASSPRLFTKFLVPVFAWFRKMGLLTVCYIDDAIFIASSFAELQEQVVFAVRWLDRLGFTISEHKSSVVPAQEIEFLGFQLCSTSMSVMVSLDRQVKIKALGHRLLDSRVITVRDLASFIGSVVATGPGVPLAPLHYRYLEVVRTRALVQGFGDYDSVMSLDDKARSVIGWWLEYDFAPGSLLAPPVDEYLFTDASNSGWGATLGQASASGHWAGSELEQINILELKAILLGLRSLCRDLRHIHIEVNCDNSTAVSCVNRCGSTKVRLLALTEEIFEWCETRNIALSAVHVKGVDNVEADRLSRDGDTNKEWTVKDKVFLRICRVFSLPRVDLFASRINKRVPCYVSWKPDPDAFAFNAFSLPWDGDFLYYAFPPFCLLGRVIRKTLEDRALVLLIAPLWPTRPFFSRLLQLCVAQPRILPKGALFLPQAPERKHPLSSLCMGVFLISGEDSKVQNFQKTLPALCSMRGGQEPGIDMGTTSGGGCSFAVRGRLIRCLRL